MMETEDLQQGYLVVAELFLHPEERDRDAIARALPTIGDARVRDLLNGFMEDPMVWSSEEYLQTIELTPPCPLYLGHYLFEEPSSCRGAGSSGRNGFMLELNNMYQHFGVRSSGRELPDFLPLMIDFLRMSLSNAERNGSGIRRWFVENYMKPGLEKLSQAFVKYESGYARLVDALRLLLEHDLATMTDYPSWTPPTGTHKKPIRRSQPAVMEAQGGAR